MDGHTRVHQCRADVARIAMDGIATGTVEIVADNVSRQVQAGLAGAVAALYPQFA